MRPNILLLHAALAAFPVLAADTAADPQLLAKAKELQKKVTAIDCHLDLPLDYTGAAEEGKTQFDLPKAARGGLKAASLAVFVDMTARTPEGYATAAQQAEKKYELIRAVAGQNPDRAAIAYTPEDVRRITRQGKFAVIISLLNAYPLGTDLSQLDRWHERGVRILGFTQGGNNAWADSSRPKEQLGDKVGENGGLSELGKQGVAKLNQLGVLIDISQLSTAAVKQVLSLSKAPVIASHSAIRALADSPRNLTDEELELLRKNGGVLGVVAYNNYLRKAPQMPAGQKAPPATMAQYGDAIDYAVKKLGVDHVALSTDFNHGGGIAGWQDESEATNVTAELLRRGYSERDIAKLWGDNILRVWGEAQKAAASSRASR
jgi:microsomal dipeptidase-like Zn-dependent dipeptidase